MCYRRFKYCVDGFLFYTRIVRSLKTVESKLTEDETQKNETERFFVHKITPKNRQSKQGANFRGRPLFQASKHAATTASVMMRNMKKEKK